MELLGLVESNEKEEIQKIYNRRKALEELLTTSEYVIKSDDNFQKIVDEVANSKKMMDEWWQKIAKKYDWQYSLNNTWNINFATNEISIL